MKHLLIAFGLLSTAVILTQCTTPTGVGENLPPATKDSPFVNSLGMKFVPVPGTRVLFCTTETTVAQYQAAGLGYNPPPFPQGSNHPAVNVSWHDAKAWCAWLSKKEGRKYRLPTNAEWMKAAGPTTYPWGFSWPPPSNSGNYMGQEHKGSTASVTFHRMINDQSGIWGVIGAFKDNHVFTAPVGSYPGNNIGIFDLSGNIWEWCEDKHPTLSGNHILKGGSWMISMSRFLSTTLDGASDPRCWDYGFRCVLVR